MSATRIKIKTMPCSENLAGRSHWWGFPDLPDDLDWPDVPVNDDGEVYGDPLTFVCQVRCEDFAPFDPDGVFPHTGMLYFFAAMDYWLGNQGALAFPGLGEWSAPYFRVLYSPDCDGLNTHKLLYDDGSSACLPAEKIVFGEGDGYTGFGGEPYLDEIREAMPGMLSLLQIDEDDRWNLRFFDCGMLCFLISPQSLSERRWQDVKCYLHSF